MRHASGPLSCLLVVAALIGTAGHAIAAGHKQILHGKKPETAGAAAREHKQSGKHKEAARHGKEKKKIKETRHVAAKRHRKVDAGDEHVEKAAPELTGDLAIVKDAIGMVRRGKTSDAIDAEKTIADPAGRKLVEWFLLRHPDSQAPFDRYAAFIADNPDWPGVALLRRRAEARLWDDKIDAATVHAFTSDSPVTAKGRLALARVLLGEGDRDGATRLVRAVFRSEDLSERTESDVIDTFRDSAHPWRDGTYRKLDAPCEGTTAAWVRWANMSSVENIAKPIARAINIYRRVARHELDARTRRELARHIRQLAKRGVKDSGRLTVHGLSYLRHLDMSDESR